MIICITGLPGAGKTSVAKILQRRGFKAYELGDVVREMMRKQGIPITPDSDKKFTIELRKKHGNLVTVQYLLKKVKLKRHAKIAIVGVRSKYELDYIKKHAPVVTIAVVAPAKLRYERIKKRGRPDAPRSLREFIVDRDKKEEKWGLLKAIGSADYVISGAGNIIGLKHAVYAILKSESDV
jgi:dephospho-CoA kinase